MTGDATYTAVVTETVNKYKVSFVDWDNSPISSKSYDYGTKASVIKPAENPTRDADDEYSYTFADWTPTVVAVTGEATYKATYTKTALSSSSSVKPSSSSEKPASSSAEKPKSSSSLAEDASSSSEAKDDVESSASGKTDALYPTVAGLNMVFSHNELTITVSKASEVKVQVFDMRGNLQERYQGHSAGDHVVSLSHLTRGVYIVRVACGGMVKTQRISIR